MKTSEKIIAENSNVIVAFKIGRGGQYYNPGHLTVIGEKRIDELTSDLSISFENEFKIFKEIGDRENLQNLYYTAVPAAYTTDESAKAAYNRLKKIGLDLGKPVYTTDSGNTTGLTVEQAETGIGTIDIDGAYNTIYTTTVGDLSDNELAAIRRSTGYDGYVVEQIKAALEQENED